MDRSLSPKNFVLVGNSINKTITGHLVYASKLEFKDVTYLTTHCKNCTQGNILPVRYGVVPLRQQIIRATSLGAAGILLYQDPSDYPKSDPEAFPRTSVPETRTPTFGPITPSTISMQRPATKVPNAPNENPLRIHTAVGYSIVLEGY